jgi:hypothetical protein
VEDAGVRRIGGVGLRAMIPSFGVGDIVGLALRLKFCSTVLGLDEQVFTGGSSSSSQSSSSSYIDDNVDKRGPGVRPFESDRAEELTVSVAADGIVDRLLMFFLAFF